METGSLDTFSFVIDVNDDSLQALQSKVLNIDQIIKRFAGNASESLQGASNATAVSVSAGLDKVKTFTDAADARIKSLGAEMQQMGQKWGAVFSGLFASLAGGIAGAFSVGSLFSSYKTGVAEVARMTGVYSEQVDAWRRKRALLARVNREDIELYKKGRIALTNFDIAMGNLSTTVGRSMTPVARIGIELLEKISKWVTAHAGDITRFLSVLAGTITAVVLPALLKLSYNPFSLLVVAIAAAAVAIDDFIVYIRGGESALSGLWSVFGTGPELADKLSRAFERVKEWAGALYSGLLTLKDSVIDLWTRFNMSERTARLISALADTLSGLGGVFRALWEGAVILWDKLGGGEAVAAALALALDGVSTALEIIAGACDLVVKAWDYLTGKTGDVVGDMQALWQGFAEWLSNLWTALADKIAGFIGGILSPFKKAYNIFFGTDAEGITEGQPATETGAANAARGISETVSATADAYTAAHEAATIFNAPAQPVSNTRNNSYANSDNRVQNIYVNSTDEAKEIVSAPSFLDFNFSDMSAM